MELAIIHKGQVFGLDLEGYTLESPDLNHPLARAIIIEAIQAEVKRIQKHE